MLRLEAHREINLAWIRQHVVRIATDRIRCGAGRRAMWHGTGHPRSTIVGTEPGDRQGHTRRIGDTAGQGAQQREIRMHQGRGAEQYRATLR